MFASSLVVVGLNLLLTDPNYETVSRQPPSQARTPDTTGVSPEMSMEVPNTAVDMGFEPDLMMDNKSLDSDLLLRNDINDNYLESVSFLLRLLTDIHEHK
jgi:hypothetical protein